MLNNYLCILLLILFYFFIDAASVIGAISVTQRGHLSTLGVSYLLGIMPHKKEQWYSVPILLSNTSA